MRVPLSEWRPVTLGELAQYINGRAFAPSDWSTSGRPIIRIQNLTNPDAPFNHFNAEVDPRHLVSDGDLLISWSATLGAFIWDRGNAVLNQHIFKVQPRAEFVDKQFLYYLVQHKLAEMGERTHGSTMKHITKGKFESLTAQLPPLAEQRRIASSLDDIVSRIEEVSRLSSESMQDARQLDTAVFADFVEQVEGGRHAQVEHVPLGQLITSAQYGSSQRANPDPKGTPILRMGNIRDGYLDVSGLKHVTLSAPDLAKYRLNEGDILFNRTNSLELVGKAATVSGLSGDWVFASYLIRLVVDRRRVVPEFVTAAINSRLGRRFVHANARRAIGMVNINAQQIQRFVIPLPPLHIQALIVDKIRRARELTSALRDELSARPIEYLPGSILQRAFAGEL